MDSLKMEYEKSPFYVMSYFKTDKGEKLDGKVIINDMKTLYTRYIHIEREEELNKTKAKEKKKYNDLIEQADFYYVNKYYFKAHKLYQKAFSIDSSDKKVYKKMMKSKKLAKKNNPMKQFILTFTILLLTSTSGFSQYDIKASKKIKYQRKIKLIGNIGPSILFFTVHKKGGTVYKLNSELKIENSVKIDLEIKKGKSWIRHYRLDNNEI